MGPTAYECTQLDDLLRSASQALEHSKVYLDNDMSGKAYVQYLRASEITVNSIPHHADYETYANQSAWYNEFKMLMRAVSSKQGTMDMVKQEIMEDNRRSNLQPSSLTSTSPPAQASSPPRIGRENREQGTNSMRMPSPTQFQRISNSQSEPGRFHTSTEDVLAQRFAKLKASPPSDNEGSSSAYASSGPAGQASTYTSNTSSQHYSSPLASPPRRLIGPRSMGSPSVPMPPPKLPLTTSLPRAPDPTYSPIYSVPSQPPPNPPRTSTESARLVNPRFSHFTNSPRGSPSRGLHDPYRSTTPNSMNSGREPGSNSPDLPFTSTISAHDLVDYLRKFNVLVIDVRPREEFDAGHIYAKSVICIEPVGLKENVSAEELEERLFMSPEYEQGLFERRNEFDLVVYYDQNTASNSYLAGSPVSTSAPHLRALHDTLYEFNEYKPLKAGHPPALLLGGLDAWIDILGQQSLATSATAAVIGSIQARRPVAKPGRPLGRIPTVVSANSSLEVRKRRLREYTPLNSEELAAWLERSKREEIDTSTYLEEEQLTEEPEDGSAQPAHDPSMDQIARRYDDFLRHVPEQHHVQQSMTQAQAPPPVPPVPPNYAASVPVAPLRPPPAAPRPSYSGVSDGRFTQPHVQRQNSANRTPLYTPSSSVSRLKLPRTGLHNFGVTCYMNSTIQCLSATVTMSKFFIDDRFRFYVQKNWKGSQGVMPGLYANLIRSLWKNDVEVIMPTSFRNFCGRLNREWTIDRQQDAKEFFDFLVDCLHEDLNINWKRTPLKPLTFAQEVQRERTPISQVSKIEWDRYSHREESFISSLFAGQHASQLRCTTCKQTSTTYEAFYSISVEIPTGGASDIYSCLRSYCQEEMLSGDEVWKCPYCKCKRMATKRIMITRAPQILVVHFKRFSASKTQSARKIHTPIEFPLHGLRMDEFMISYPNTTPVPDSVTPSIGATEPPFTYDSFGVLRHIGSSMTSGHYISLIRDAQRQCWRKFDDARAMEFDPRSLRAHDRLQNDQAYIVFYERVPAK